MTRVDTDSRAALMLMVRRGQCTQAEAASLVGVSRQAVAQWLGREADLGNARARYLLETFNGLVNSLLVREAAISR